MKSKICIIGTSNIKHISFISLYTIYFDLQDVPYDIVYMDRYGIEEKISAANIFRYQTGKVTGRFSKLKEFWHFRKYAKRIIKGNQYETVITWQTTGAYMFFDFLLRKMRHRYIINVRDYVIENNVFFKYILGKLIKNAKFTTISSKGFLSFLPEHDYVLVNSINEDILNNVEVEPIHKHNIIRIGFAGNCRYFNESFKLIDALGNDKRFELWYCGTNSEKLKEYVLSKGYKNIQTVPGFSPSETTKIMSSFDFVNGAFGNDAMDNSTLMPIRLYTAMALHRPMLVNAHTQLGNEVKNANIGFVIENYVKLGDTIYNYYDKLDVDSLNISCEDYLTKAKTENEMFYKKLSEIL